MFRIAMALVAVSLFSQSSFAQLFPNAPWNRGSATARFNSSDACPGGICPTNNSVGRGVLRPSVNVNVNNAPPALIEQHNYEHNGYWGGPNWTWQGDLATQYAQSSYATAPQTTYVQQSGGSTGSVRSGGSTGSAVRSGGSTGSSVRVLRVGDLDACGNVIVSIGSTISPQLQPQPQMAGGVQQLAIGDRIAFRHSLLEAARNARKSGEITSIQFFMLSAASRNPNVLDKMQQAVHEAAIEEGLATTQAIDWAGLISFIEKLIPIIIQLIDLFG